MIEISIMNHQNVLEIDEDLENVLTELVELCLNEEGIECDGEVSILFVDDAAIHNLNKTHREKDSPTDVLSFPQYESLKDEQNMDPYVILGDVVVSTETAIRQAESYNHSLIREIGFLVVHSIFHLCGYDHDTEENTDIMRAKEEKILNAYRLTR